MTRIFGNLCQFGILVAVQLGMLCFAVVVAAQQIPDPPAVQNPNPKDVLPSAQLLEFFGRKTPYEFWLTAAILISGLMFLAMSTRFLKTVADVKLDHATRMVTTILVVLGTLVLITAGYNNEQIAPAFGLFGTLIGYLLGRSQNGATEAEETSPSTRPGDGNATPKTGADDAKPAN